jgi:hypothetical protein
MKTVATLLFATLLATPAAYAAGYQKTGTVKDATDKSIVITTEKDGDWEFKRDAGTKVEGDVKKGAKVTVYYSMSATKVEAKADAKKDDKKK